MFMIYTGIMELEGQERGETWGWGHLIHSAVAISHVHFFPDDCPPHPQPSSVSVGSERGAHRNIPQRSVIFHIF